MNGSNLAGRHDIRSRLPRHPLLDTLFSLRGNARACVFTEPLWGIPFSLYTPFFTVYVYALGATDRQIGILLSLSLFCQVFAAFFGGILTDRLGRRLTTLVFDLLAWSVPVLLWMLARNFWWFVVAAVLNSLCQITNISWNCLMVEDCNKSQLVHIYTWCTISGLLSVFFAPLSGMLVARMGVIDAVRILMGLTFLLMTSKFIILQFLSKETRQGLVRMAETRRQPLGRLLGEYRPLAGRILRSPVMRTILAIQLILSMTASINSSFFALYATQNLGLPQPYLAYFPIARAAVMLVFIFTVQTALSRRPFKVPMVAGFVLYLAGQLVLLSTPAKSIGPLLAVVLCEAFAYALVGPQRDAMLVLLVEPRERARIVSLISVSVIAIASPFGWIAGELSQMNRRWPFILNATLFAGCIVLILLSQVRADPYGQPQAGS